MANDNRIQLYVSDEVKKSIEAYAKYHDVSVSPAGAELLMQGAMNWSPSEDTQRYKNQPVNLVNAEIPNTEYITRGEFTAMIASICAQVGMNVGEVRAGSRLIEQNVNMAKKIQESHENMIKALLEGYEEEDTTDGNGQRSNVKLG